jgi:HSP20 family protein
MLTTYDFLNDMSGLRNWFDGFFDERPYITRRTDFPYVNLYENGDTIEVAVLAPGVKAENINLQLIDNRLTIEAEKHIDYKDTPYIRKERNFGTFKKTVVLPYRADQNKIEAVMKEGILTVKLVRAEETKPKKIEIN